MYVLLGVLGRSPPYVGPLIGLGPVGHVPLPLPDVYWERFQRPRDSVQDETYRE